MTHSRTAAITACATALLFGAFHLGQTAQASDPPRATCEIMDWKPLKPAASMAQFQQMVGAHSAQGTVQIMPLTSQGGTTGFMICSW